MAKQFADLADVQKAFKANRKLGYFRQNALKKQLKKPPKNNGNIHV